MNVLVLTLVLGPVAYFIMRETFRRVAMGAFSKSVGSVVLGLVLGAVGLAPTLVGLWPLDWGYLILVVYFGLSGAIAARLIIMPLVRRR